jgi:hypothetical protein
LFIQLARRVWCVVAQFQIRATFCLRVDFIAEVIALVAKLMVATHENPFSSRHHQGA